MSDKTITHYNDVGSSTGEWLTESIAMSNDESEVMKWCKTCGSPWNCDELTECPICVQVFPDVPASE